MEAIRETVEVTGGAENIRLPVNSAAGRDEIVVLPTAEDDAPRLKPQRGCRPAPELAGTRILDDLIELAVDPGDCDAVQ